VIYFEPLVTELTGSLRAQRSTRWFANDSDYPFMKMKIGPFRGTAIIWRVMRWHRFAPEEKNKENGNDTNCLCHGGRNVADICCFGDVASRADRASQRRCHRRPEQCNAGVLASLASRLVRSPSPLLAWPLGPRALPLVVVVPANRLLIRRADRIRRGVFILSY
jgi:hypothetical protein